MKITVLCSGKTTDDYIKKGFHYYASRINHYFPFAEAYTETLKNSRNIPVEMIKTKESELLMKNILPGSVVVLLDENGTMYTSKEFAAFLQQQANNSVKQLVFCIGGPYGFSDNMMKKASYKISLSKMTFSHQLVRLIFAEQLYRACTILKGEPYHHE